MRSSPAATEVAIMQEGCLSRSRPQQHSAGDLSPARGTRPTLADPFPADGPLPGAYELHLPSDGVMIWYVVAPYQGQEIISIQLVRLDT